MNNALLYIITVLIWGTTWYAIKLQLGHAPDEISIFYRAGLAAFCLVAWCKMKGISLRFKAKDHLFLCLLGLSMFSLHYLFVYNATNYIVSGVIAVIFSATSFLNIFNNYLFFKTKPHLNIVLGVLLGFGGLCIFFWHEFTQVSFQNTTLKGFLLAGVGTIIFSFSSSISKRNNQRGLAILPCMTMGMIYGTLAMFIYTLFQPYSFVFPASGVYWMSLLYLVIPGSIVAFLFYLQLIKNIGPELAGYTTVLFPVVALGVSSVLENYEWSFLHFLGLSLVISGNILVMSKKKNASLANSCLTN